MELANIEEHIVACENEETILIKARTEHELDKIKMKKQS